MLKGRWNLTFLNLELHSFFWTNLEYIDTLATWKGLTLSFLLQGLIGLACYTFRHLNNFRRFDLFALDKFQCQPLGLSFRNQFRNRCWLFINFGKLSEDSISWFIKDCNGCSFGSPIANLGNIAVINNFFEDVMRNGRIVMPVGWCIQSLSGVLMASLQIIASWPCLFWFLELNWNFLASRAFAPCKWIFFEWTVLTHNDYWKLTI